MRQRTAPPPASATDGRICLIGAAAGLAGVLLAAGHGFNAIAVTLAVLGAMAATIAALDLGVARVHRRPSAGLGPARPGDRRRVWTKLLSLHATFALCALGYVAIPIYHDDRFNAFFLSLAVALPFLSAAALVYVPLVDARMREPRDGCWEFGRLLLGDWRGRDWPRLRTYLLGWAIKGFFLPLMFDPLCWLVEVLTRAPLAERLDGPVAVIMFAAGLSLFLDLAFAVVGYLATLRVLDTHVRSCNPFLYGWVFTLVCYYPLWPLVEHWLLYYEDGQHWTDWLADMPWLLLVWGTGIVALKIVWAWSNVVFGLRFSNLTHRGIVTAGPFRLTKHPMYVVKNVFWWVASMPFLSTGGWDTALEHCLMLAGVNAIYWVRARAEEAHLSEDPDYRAYAAWIDEHGLFRGLGRVRRRLAAAWWRPALGQLALVTRAAWR